jgi:hypothetical protein
VISTHIAFPGMSLTADTYTLARALPTVRGTGSWPALSLGRRKSTHAEAKLG